MPNPTHPLAPLRIALSFSIAALAATLSGCGSTPAPDLNRIHDLPELTVSERLRIGSVDDPEAGFSGIAAVDVDDEGNLFVVEGSVPEIRVYSPEGVLLRRFGRRGDGPGEFQWPSPFGVQGDTVWAVDSRHRRITVFTRSGQLVSTDPIQEAPVRLTNGTAFSYPFLMRPDGTLTGKLSMLSYAGGDPSLVSGPSDLIPVPLVRFTASGEVIDTIGLAERPPPGLWRPAAEEVELPGFVEVNGRRHLLPVPNTTLGEYLQLADGYVLVERPQPRTEEGAVTVTRLASAGDTIFRRELQYDAPRYSSGDLDSIAALATRGVGLSISRVGGSMPDVENPEAVTNRLRAEMEFPEFQVPVERAWAANDESVWIAYRPAIADTITWVILNADGSSRGRIALPRAVRPLWNRGDTLIASVLDELDVPWLVQYTLQASDQS